MPTQFVKTSTMEKLKSYGELGDSFDDVINKILDMVAKQQDQKRG